MRETAEKFEEVVSKLLTHIGFNVLTKPSHVDFFITNQKTTFAVEIKYYKTQRAQLKLLSNAAKQIRLEMDKDPALKGLLIVSCSLTDSQNANLKKEYGISVFDRQFLLSLASDSPELTEDLYALFEINPDDLSISIEKFYSLDKELAPPTNSEPEEPAPPDTTGTELCRSLQAIEPGKPGWSKYEEKCREILEYLFKDHLAGWKEQQRTDDELNRFDLICRVKPATDFWNFIIHNLHSRYMLFEFKNYAEPIKQGQVLTTEKYLLEKGLRKVAIMITRKGAHGSATKMAQGAMRETGKLIIILDDNQICKMLHMKEKGDDPTDYLFDITDDFLLSLPR
ncbi:restriction endonuclease [Pseudomonas mediterranea]|uniref:restriction endonuclease n=1 Tax=Pseudomonas mediterranea TaxID=183795 RepID=UPI0006D888CB|nr:restriction endonuclease [Pseudomonas mediterranea]